MPQGLPTVATIFALLAGAAGWYYLFYSKAARRLAGVEGGPVNARRHLLRRANGALLLVLGGLFYAGFTINPDAHRVRWAAVWFAVLLLLLAVIALVLVDMRLTARLRRRLKP